MAYQLKLGGEPLKKGVRRIIARESGRITNTLEDTNLTSARQVHEVRKSVKRLRSLLRLIEPVADGVRTEIVVLRDAARKLSSSRDTGAILDRLERLDLPAEISTTVKAALLTSMEAQAADTGITAELLATFHQEVRSSAKRAAKIDIHAEGFDTVEAGLRRSYKKLRKSFTYADQTREEVAIHDWRKNAKLHWHHTRLLVGLCPDLLQAHSQIASRVSGNLGEWRDAGLLLQALPSGALDKETLESVTQAICIQQKRLMEDALRDSRMLTAETPANLAARWQAYWTAQSL